MYHATVNELHIKAKSEKNTHRKFNYQSIKLQFGGIFYIIIFTLVLGTLSSCVTTTATAVVYVHALIPEMPVAPSAPVQVQAP